jgi:hypothetical protein
VTFITLPDRRRTQNGLALAHCRSARLVRIIPAVKPVRSAAGSRIMVWGDTTTTYVICQARIVAMVKDRGAIVELGDFEFEEGRLAVEYGGVDADQHPPLLEYTAAFRTLGAGMSDAGEAVEARIVILGTCDDGPIEIRGDGWFGYDDKGGSGRQNGSGNC